MRKDENISSADLLKATGEIDEAYIEEAEETAEVRTEVKTDVRRIRRWGKWVAGIAAVFVLFVGANAVLDSGFLNVGSADSADKEAAENMNFAPQAAFPEADMVISEDMAANYEALSGLMEYGSDKEQVTKEKTDTKLIYRANISVQSTDFEATVEQIQSMVEQMEGYIENSSVYNGDYYDEGYTKNGSYTVRLPQKNYANFINAVGEGCHVVMLNESVEDVGESYFEIEGRLESLRIKQERLQSLMRSADNMSDLIELESALSETEYMIERYTTDLNHYDSLIDYSTVCIDVQQVIHYENGINVDRSFGARLLESLKDGVSNFLWALDDIVMWISYNLITLIIIAAAVVLCIKFRVISRIRHKL